MVTPSTLNCWVGQEIERLNKGMRTRNVILPRLLTGKKFYHLYPYFKNFPVIPHFRIFRIFRVFLIFHIFHIFFRALAASCVLCIGNHTRPITIKD